MKKKSLASSVNDRSRHVAIRAKENIVVHKFTPQGDPIDLDKNFDPRRDISRLSMDDLRLLSALQEKKWDLKAACESLQIDPTEAAKRFKKLSYFKFEDQKARALAAIATPEFVASKNIEGFYADNLTDGQRDHLKELAKISGAYKNTTNVNVSFNAFVRPILTPDQEQKTREFFDTIATQELPA